MSADGRFDEEGKPTVVATVDGSKVRARTLSTGCCCLLLLFLLLGRCLFYMRLWAV